MKIAFSTLGCPRWSWEDIISTAKDLGFDGVEVRGIENELHVPKAKPFLEENVDKTLSKIKRLGLEIPCLTSSCYLFDREDIESHINEAKQYIDIAQKIGTPYVRVLADGAPEPGEGISDDFVAHNARTLAKYAEGKNVRVLIESNGVYADSKRLLELVEKVNHENIGVLWDVHHPFRYMRETIEFTLSNLYKHLCHIHIKDSIIDENNKVKYKMIGGGDVPVKEALFSLKEKGYTGYVSLEWVKRWYIDLEEPGVVFSQFASYVKDIIK